MNRPLAALACVLLASAASAAPVDAPTVFAKLKPKVGSWAEYSVVSTKGGEIKNKTTFHTTKGGSHLRPLAAGRVLCSRPAPARCLCAEYSCHYSALSDVAPRNGARARRREGAGSCANGTAINGGSRGGPRRR